MSATIVLNQSNIVSADNNTFVYKFPNSVPFPHHQIAIQSATMYYSWENVNDTTLANNVFTYGWIGDTIVGASHIPNVFVVQVVLPPGLYEIETINAYFQFICIQQGTYLINQDGQYIYYGEIVVNASQYAIQVNTFPVPTWEAFNGSTASVGGVFTGTGAYLGWTTPLGNPTTGAGAWVGFPPSVNSLAQINQFGYGSFNPSFVFPANFNLIVGFAVGYQTSWNTDSTAINSPQPFPQPGPTTPATQNQNLSYLSSTAPQVQPNPSVYFSISNINNPYAIPSSIIYSISPSVGFGEQINDRPPQYTWNKLLPGTYNEIRLQLLGTNKAPLTILDGNMTILLAIRDTHDTGAEDLISRLQGGKY
jgi:hypothetical protein